MSKVIKDTDNFVPEEIVLDNFEEYPLWSTDSNQIKQDTFSAEKRNLGPSTEAFEPQEDYPSTETSTSEPFTDDFSAPESSNVEAKDTKSSDQHEDPSEEPKSDKQETIDLEALADEYYNKGIQAGIERVESDFGLSIKTAQSICEQLNSIRETILKNSMDEMRDLVLKISEKIIRNSVISQKDTVIQTIEEAIQKAVKSDEFIISVNPDDYVTIKTKSADFISSISGLENIIVRSDGSIDPGGCIIESSNCTVDATLAGQLEVIADSLQGKL